MGDTPAAVADPLAEIEVGSMTTTNSIEEFVTAARPIVEKFAIDNPEYADDMTQFAQDEVDAIQRLGLSLEHGARAYARVDSAFVGPVLQWISYIPADDLHAALLTSVVAMWDAANPPTGEEKEVADNGEGSTVSS